MFKNHKIMPKKEVSPLIGMKPYDFAARTHRAITPGCRLAFFVLLITWAGPVMAGKFRVINTTDLGADVDDQQSLVRAMVTANNFDLEGLIATTSCWRTSQTSNNMANLLDPILNAYGQVLTNLQVHAIGYPSLTYLRSISMLGQSGFGMAAVGAGKDSPGSELIIATVDKNDPRPVWVNLWGGGNTLAQALWKVQTTRSQAQLDQFINKLRVYDILGQDDAGAWMTKTFTNLFYIRFLGVYNWQPSDNWVATNIQSHGQLGAVYPNRVWATEGDTPAFLYQYPNELNDPEHPDWGSWGGRCNPVKKTGVRGMTGGAAYNEAQYDPYYMYSDAPEGGSSIGRWSTAINNDFAARMDWSLTNSYSAANHHPIAVLNNTTNGILNIPATAGANVVLSAVGTSDPDGNALTYSWFYYDEPSSYDGTVTIQNSATPTATVAVPADATGKTIHVILEVRDDGSPNLYAYRRAIISLVAPAIPGGVRATTASSNQVNLMWNASTNAGSYNIKRSTTNGGPYTVIATNVTATTFSDTGLTPSTTYYYVVSAVSALESGNSAQASATTGSALRLRVVITTDFPPTNVCMPNLGCPANQTSDPDDVQSMVRWLLYVNEFDVEGMVASSGTFAGIANKTNILNMLDLYALVHTNLLQHDARYPPANALRAVTFQGRSGTWGGSVANNIGAGKDSEASEAIINIVDKPDPRPVWFCVWGDCSNIAQAIWKVQNTRSAGALQTFLSKIRIHQIAHQDDTIDWLMSNFPNIFIIYSQTTYQGIFNSDNLAWANENIRQNHGPLGAVYPPRGIANEGVCEGDTPSFLHLVSALRGLNNPEDPTQNSWGGRFNRDGTTSHYIDGPGGASISMWKTNFQAEFKERADWMVSGSAPTLGEPAIGFTPDWLAAQTSQGQNAQSVSLIVSNAGTGTLTYSLTNGATWLAVTPATGNSTGNAVTHTVSFITSGLPPGDYLSWLTINAPAATQPLASVPIAVRVRGNIGNTNYAWNTPIISLELNEGSGTVTINQGSAGGSLTRSTPVPNWTNNVPAGVGGATSVDFQTNTGNYFIESPTNYPQLTGLSKFTVAGWANCRSSTTGSGGNRLVTWINSGGDGVDVVYKNDGSVQVGINQWPDTSPAVSSAGKITSDADAAITNWRFFAVTYDSTLASNHVKFYFGSSGNPAALDVAKTYARGLTGTNISRLCIGHFNTSFRNSGLNRMFRGLLDQVQVFDKALAIDEIQAIQAGVPTPPPDIRIDALNSQWLLLTWSGANLILEQTADITGPWSASPNQAGAQLVEPVGHSRYFRLR